MTDIPTTPDDLAAVPQKKPLENAVDAEITALEIYCTLYKQNQKTIIGLMAIENQIRYMIGKREGLVWPGGIVTWKVNENGEKELVFRFRNMGDVCYTRGENE